jgi:hypothetical protein
MKDIKPRVGDKVEFDDGRSNRITGTVTRAPWGRTGNNVTIKTDEAKPRTFVRLLKEVTAR